MLRLGTSLVSGVGTALPCGCVRLRVEAEPLALKTRPQLLEE